MLAKLASLYSSKLAAKLIALGAQPPAKEVSASAAFEQHGFQVIVTIAPYAGPMRISQSVLDKILAFGASQTMEKPMSGAKTNDDAGNGSNQGEDTYREMDSCIMEAAPAADARAVSMKRLASLAGYSYTLWFRQAVDRLIVAGQLVRTSQGVRKKG